MFIDCWVSKTDTHEGQLEPTSYLTIDFPEEHVDWVRDHLGGQLAVHFAEVTNVYVTLVPRRPGEPIYRTFHTDSFPGRYSINISQEQLDLSNITPSFCKTQSKLMLSPDGRVYVYLPQQSLREPPRRLSTVEGRDVNTVKTRQLIGATNAALHVTVPVSKPVEPRCTVLVDLDGETRELHLTPAAARALVRDGCPGETQSTIEEWRARTFPDESIQALNIATRANIEMAELLDILGREPRPGALNSEWRAWREAIAKEAADVLIVLYGVAVLTAFDLHEAVDDKMKINRARRWERLPSGRYQHVKETP